MQEFTLISSDFPDFPRALMILSIWCVFFIQERLLRRRALRSLVHHSVTRVRPPSSGPLRPLGCVISARSAVPTLIFHRSDFSPRGMRRVSCSRASQRILRASLWRARARASPRPRVRTPPDPHLPDTPSSSLHIKGEASKRLFSTASSGDDRSAAASESWSVTLVISPKINLIQPSHAPG